MDEPIERVRSPFVRQQDGPGPAAPAPTAVTEAGPRPVPPPAAPALPSVRPTTGYEEDLVLRLRDAGPVRLCNEVLACCLVPPGHDPGDAGRATIRALPIAVRDRLLLELRRRSFGDRMEVRTSCPACGEKVEAALDLAELGQDVPTGPARFDDRLSDGRTVTVRLPTGGDQEALEAEPADNEAHRRTALLARLVERIGEEDRVDAAAVHALPTRDRLALERRIGAETPMFDLSLGLTCPACAHAWVAPIEVTRFFLTS